MSYNTQYKLWKVQKSHKTHFLALKILKTYLLVGNNDTINLFQLIKKDSNKKLL